MAPVGRTPSDCPELMHEFVAKPPPTATHSETDVVVVDADADAVKKFATPTHTHTRKICAGRELWRLIRGHCDRVRGVCGLRAGRL